MGDHRRTTAVSSPPEVVIDEPPRQHNRRHPTDLLRLLVAVIVTVVGFSLATMINQVSEAITVQVVDTLDNVPSAVMVVLLLLTSAAGAILPFVVVWYFVGHKRWRSLALAGIAVIASLAILWLVKTYLVSTFSTPNLLSTQPAWICGPDRASRGLLDCIVVPPLSNPLLRFGSLVSLTAFFSTIAPHLTHRWKRYAWIAIALFATTRVILYLDAPVDELLAIGIAYAMGAAVLLMFGEPDRRPRGFDVAEGLERVGLRLAFLQRAGVDARGSMPYFGIRSDGKRLFIKVLTHDDRDSDIMFRVVRMFRLRDVGDEIPFLSLKRAVEHEAVASLMASKDGVMTPQLQAIADIPPTSMMMAYDQVDGRSLDTVAPDSITDELLCSIWKQVAILRDHRTAHRDLRLANVLFSSDGKPWLIDFGFSELAATEGELRSDVAELIASTAPAVGARRAVACAIAVLGPEPVADASSRIQPSALTRATRGALKQQRGLDEVIREQIEAQTGVEETPLENLERVGTRTVLMIFGFALAMYFLIPELAKTDFRAVLDADWEWTPAILLAAFATYVGAALNIMGSVSERIQLAPSILAQFAGTFVNRITPVKIGGMATNVRYLQKSGIDLTSAAAGVGLANVVTMAVHMALLLFTVITLGRNADDFIKLPSENTVLVGLVAVFTLSSLVLFLPLSRKLFVAKVWPAIKSSGRSLGRVATSPEKILMLFGGSFTIIIASIGALWLSLEAFGGGLSIAGVALTFLGGQALGNLAPIPGGIGATEAAMIAAMTALGLDATTAVSATFLYRIATFWLPILPGVFALRRLESDGLL
ncbi:MAG: flippase-like domain-containing protein [Acidimicrobiia bacterium]|nr:flippase-like domain-containing protein [Acidimicrobiia bacterium]